MRVVRWFGLAHGVLGWSFAVASTTAAALVLGDRVIAVPFIASARPRPVALVELVGVVLAALGPALLRPRALTWERARRRAWLRSLKALLVVATVTATAAMPWICHAAGRIGQASARDASLDIAVMAACAFLLAPFTGPVLAGPLVLGTYLLLIYLQEASFQAGSWVPLVDGTADRAGAPILVGVLGTSMAAAAWAVTLGRASGGLRQERHDDG